MICALELELVDRMKECSALEDIKQARRREFELREEERHLADEDVQYGW